MPEPEAITIEFEITRDDYLAWTAWLREQPKQAAEWRRFYRKRRGLITLAAIMTVIVGVSGYNKLPDIVDRGDHWSGGMLMMLVAGVVGYWWYVLQLFKKVNPATIEEQRQRDADSERGRLWQGRKRVTVAGDSLRWEAAHCTYVIRWSRVRRVWREWAFVLVDMGLEGVWPIPARAFADDGAAERFVALATGCHGGSGAADHLRAVLRERDVKCPGCGYNLRGSDGEKCPECGRRVGLGDVVRT